MKIIMRLCSISEKSLCWSFYCQESYVYAPLRVKCTCWNSNRAISYSWVLAQIWSDFFEKLK